MGAPATNSQLLQFPHHFRPLFSSHLVHSQCFHCPALFSSFLLSLPTLTSHMWKMFYWKNNLLQHFIKSFWTHHLPSHLPVGDKGKEIRDILIIASHNHGNVLTCLLSHLNLSPFSALLSPLSYPPYNPWIFYLTGILGKRNIFAHIIHFCLKKLSGTAVAQRSNWKSSDNS